MEYCSEMYRPPAIVSLSSRTSSQRPLSNIDIHPSTSSSQYSPLTSPTNLLNVNNLSNVNNFEYPLASNTKMRSSQERLSAEPVLLLPLTSAALQQLSQSLQTPRTINSNSNLIQNSNVDAPNSNFISNFNSNRALVIGINSQQRPLSARSNFSIHSTLSTTTAVSNISSSKHVRSLALPNSSMSGGFSSVNMRAAAKRNAGVALLHQLPSRPSSNVNSNSNLISNSNSILNSNLSRSSASSIVIAPKQLHLTNRAVSLIGKQPILHERIVNTNVEDDVEEDFFNLTRLSGQRSRTHVTLPGMMLIVANLVAILDAS